VVATPVVASGAAYEAGYWLPMAGPGIAAGLALAATYAVSYAVEGRQRRFVRQAFQQYLSPQVIDSLMAHPERLSLGGETRELTIMFSDVAGFTSLSEGLDPQTLTALLNDYLSAMSEIILEEGGTIDKYEGDAIICFWNAPLDLADHPARAVRAVLRCREELADSQADWVARYGHPVQARFGVNTGPVVVGNLGSRQRFDYTFLGDAGNLAARLEGVNKVFGTGALVSGATWEQLEGAYSGRRVGRVQVVGRDEPVTVYEPLDADDAVQRRETLDSFAEALMLLESGRTTEAAETFRRLADDDPVSAAYRDALSEPDSGEWDGIWRLTEK